jgi:hypothetical protein
MTKELKETLIYLLKKSREEAEQTLDMYERWNDEQTKESKAWDLRIEKQKTLIKTLKSYTKELKSIKNA